MKINKMIVVLLVGKPGDGIFYGYPEFVTQDQLNLLLFVIVKGLSCKLRPAYQLFFFIHLLYVKLIFVWMNTTDSWELCENPVGTKSLI